MFSGAILNDPLFHIELTLGEGQFETAITHVRINDLWNNTSGTEVSLQISWRYQPNAICMVSTRYLFQMF